MMKYNLEKNNCILRGIVLFIKMMSISIYKYYKFQIQNKKNKKTIFALRQNLILRFIFFLLK